MEQPPAPRPKKSRRYTAESQTVSDSVLLGVFEMPHGAGRPDPHPETAGHGGAAARTLDPTVDPKSGTGATTGAHAQPTAGTAETGKKAPVAKQSEPLLPSRAAEDDPRRWGDGDDDLGEWLKSQRPPHWD